MKSIPLTQGKTALVSDFDFERVSKYVWCATRKDALWYASRRNGKKRLFLHHFIQGSNARTDHLDGNGLNNQRNNLRIATQQENCRNRRPTLHSSVFKGVSKISGYNKWRATISDRKRRINLGCYDSDWIAAMAYDAASIVLFGEFAKTNVDLGLL